MSIQPSPGTSPDDLTDLRPLLDALDSLEPSADPAVVFAGVTRLCVPMLCDAATAIIVHDAQCHQLSWPIRRTDIGDPAGTDRMQANSQIVGDTAIRTPITGTCHDDIVDYHGTLTLNFSASRPGPSRGLLARLVVERAVALIERQRLIALAATHQRQAEHLQVALSTNRQIGTALGILMTSMKVTNERAFDLLRQVSQYTHRKLHDVALDVIDTGTIELPEDGIASGTALKRPARPEAPAARARPRPLTPCTTRI